ncbi:MAG: SDR family NAD(P)-dependent oxidoreductase [Proteobacteria bacterium]|nr:SDR family NAD(P)-dependent oxidoreductase [Pseudomonadota bacterium]
MQGKNFIITGGSSGLGLELAKHYASEANNIGLIARNLEKLQAVVEQLKVLSPDSNIFYCSTDVSVQEDAEAAVSQLAAALGGIDTLINSAGILREGRFENTPIETFREVMDINLFGTINIIQAALPYLKTSQGSIVNIASMAAHTGVFGYTTYTASKHALAGFTDSLRYEMKPQGVSVQIICPPEFDSPMVDELNKDRTPENRAHTLMIPKEPIEVIVKDTVKAIESGRYHTVTGFRAKVMAVAIRLLPGLGRSMADKAIKKAAAD